MGRMLITGLLIFFHISGFGEDSIPIKEPERIIQQDVSIKIISGNNQTVRVGRYLREAPVIMVFDKNNKPVRNVPVSISLSPVRYSSEDPDASEFVTDSAGRVSLLLKADTRPGEYEYVLNCKNSFSCDPVILNVIVRKSNWVFLLLIGLFGGLSFFIFGMSLMSEGLQNSAGNRMRNILGRLTNNRFIALGIGALVTIVIQSSSATNVMLISFVNSKLMRFRQTIGVILGAAIGTTITAQIIAFKLTDYALLFVILGFLLQVASKKQRQRDIGKAILGFGILFFGMHIMSESMSPLRTFGPFIDMILRLQNPALGILVGALLTALIQSSSAFIGILIILSMQGLLTMGAAIPLLIGANIGTSITAILASLNGSREAKQVALAHTLFKIIGGAIVVFFIPSFIELMAYLSHGPNQHAVSDMNMISQPREIANAHTIYNVVLCLIFLPITKVYSRLISAILPITREEEDPLTLRFINDGLLKTPAIAIDSAREELVRMMRKVYQMTEKIIIPFIDKQSKPLNEIERAEEEINFLRDEIKEFLVKASQGDLSTDSTEEAFIMMNAVREFEQIADTISTQLLNKAKEWCDEDNEFSSIGKVELVTYHKHTLAIILKAINVFENFDLKKAIKLKSNYDGYREEFFKLELQHYERLRENNESSKASSKTHLEIITLLRVISSHAINTIRILIYKTNHRKSR